MTNEGKDVRDMVLAAESKLSEVAPAWLSVERLTRLALAARSRTPKLAECSPESFLLFCMRCAETGLEPIGAGGAWPVPFYNNKNQSMEVQFIPDWRGLINLAKRTDQIKHAYGDVVCENDEIEYQKGDDPHLTHRPDLRDRGEPFGVYCVVQLPDDSKHIEYMTFDEVETIRNRSKAGEFGPWKTDWGQMAIKTVVRRALKPFAGSPQMQTAIALDNAATGLLAPVEKAPVAMPKAIEAEVVEPEPEPAPKQPASTPSSTGNMAVVVFAGMDTQVNKPGDKKKWKRYYGKASDGNYYSTFDTSDGELLLSLQGSEVTIKYTENEKGRTIVGVIEASDAQEPPAATAAPEPTPSPDDDDLPFTK